MQSLISIVIPVYGSAEILPILSKRINEVFIKNYYEYEVIFVDDCGPDNSWEIINKIATQNKCVKGFQMRKNYSQANATLCGIRQAKGQIIVTMDDDLQHPPEVLPLLIEKLNYGFDLVYGPPEKRQYNIFRDFFTVLTKYFLEFPLGTKKARYICSLRVFNSDLREAFSNFNSEIVNIDFLLSYSTNNIGIIKVPHEPRLKGNSGYNLSSLIRHTLTIITSYSTKPLRISTFIGLSMASFGMIIFLYVVLSWFLVGNPVRGFTFLAPILASWS